MTTQLHLASQYLAAAGISFVEKKDDDSHTNLGFSIDTKSLYTRNLNKSQVKLSLHYDSFSLEWNDQGSKNTLQLDGITHFEVLQWIDKMAKTSNLGTYSYDLHYDLPYKIQDDYTFKQDVNKLQELKEYRILTHRILKTFLDKNNLHSEIRIWPHHFDSGAFAPLEDESGLAIGLGLAIPDSMHDDYYLYISGYHGHSSVETEGFPSLSLGTWQNEGFKGAILSIKGIDEAKGVQFFQEAFDTFKK